MTTSRLILIGAGGHARSCIDVIEQQDYFEIAGLVGLPEQRDEQHFGYSVIGLDSDLPALAKIYRYALIAIGQIKNAEQRIFFYERAKQLGFQFPIVISPTAYVSPHAKIGGGTIVMHGAIVNAGASVGNNCIINSNALLEHDTNIADHCHISTGAILNGNVSVSSGCFIGSGSVIKQGLTMGRSCLVGMGSIVRASLNHNSHFYGQESHDQ
jgi:sugar O-acyltransferase (sialic acid O-acetyltransferase NeuD family)